MEKMLMANCDHEKTVVISPTTNEWSQSQLNEKSTLMTSTTTTNLMEKPSHAQDLSHSQLHQNQQQQQPPLKCPRCDSSNTKFCYYNNYSLSQPRHFCKACKRYWTRGGTLRNVPVGGGCRKNKRVRRATSSGTNGVEGSTSASSSANIINPNNPQPQVEVSSALNHVNNLFYGLPTNPSEMNLAFPSRISGGFQHHHDILQPQLNSLGLGFSSSASSSSALMSISTSTTSSDHPHNLVNGFASNSLLSSYNSIFGSTSGTASASPTMATLLASNFQQKKFQNGGATRGINQFQGLTSLEELQHQMYSVSNGNGVSMKEVKVEGGAGENRLEWNMNNQIDQISGFTSDPSSLYWNTTSNSPSVGPWHDPTNIGSSVTSLI